MKDFSIDAYHDADSNNVKNELRMPSDPIEDSTTDEEAEDEEYESSGYEWTEDDAWDALTDGMYGERPSSPWEYDAMLDAMGF